MILPKSFSMFSQPRYILQLKKNQYKKINELEKIQSKRLKHIVTHVYYHVPYYHFLFKQAGIRPSDVKTVNDLTKLPALSKADFLQNWEKLVSNTAHLKRSASVYTSGTTGTPLRILEDQVARDIGSAMVYYAFFECGMSITDNFLELTAVNPHFSKCIFRHGPGNAMRGIYLSVFNNPAENVDEIIKIRPDVIYSYPTALQILTEDFGNELKNLKPKLVFTQSEMLTEKVRKLIESYWGITPHDTYGSREFPRIAFECDEHQGFHVITDWLVIELMKNGENVGANEQGEIVITSLYNYTMPLIRYRLGDLATWADDYCACGRKWPLLKAIEGRMKDIIILPSGRKVPSIGIGPVLIKMIHGIKRFQIIQQSRKNFVVKVVCKKNMDGKDKERIRQQIIHRFRLACLNEDLDIQVKFVSIILPQPSGKTPDFIREM